MNAIDNAEEMLDVLGGGDAGKLREFLDKFPGWRGFCDYNAVNLEDDMLSVLVEYKCTFPDQPWHDGQDVDFYEAMAYKSLPSDCRASLLLRVGMSYGEFLEETVGRGKYNGECIAATLPEQAQAWLDLLDRIGDLPSDQCVAAMKKAIAEATDERRER